MAPMTEPLLYDGWEDDVRELAYEARCPTPRLVKTANRLRAAFTPHVHDWRFIHIDTIPTSGDGQHRAWLRCVTPDCPNASEWYHEVSLLPADLPKYDGPDPLGGEKLLDCEWPNCLIGKEGPND